MSIEGGAHSPLGFSTRVEDEPAWTRRLPAKLILLAGWLLPQFLVLGPALVGRTVPLPVELLRTPGLYLPGRTADSGKIRAPADSDLYDLVTIFPEFRDFSAREFRAGRLPIWNPMSFAGASFPVWPKYSLFELPYNLIPSPMTLAWTQLIQAVVAGSGMWHFLRRAMRLSFWPAAIAGWCAPLTGFMTLWRGFLGVGPVAVYPWLLLFVAQSIKLPWRWSCVGLTIGSAIVLLSGQADVGGLVLLTAGFYAVWLLACDRRDGASRRGLASAMASLTTSWLLAFLIAAPFLLPMLEYVRTGARMTARSQGLEERPPVGLSALPAVALPDIEGSSRPGSLRICTADGGQKPAHIAILPRPEGSATAYAGLLALFWLAPLAWCHIRFRRQALFFTAVAIAGLAWTLDLPGFVQVMRLKPFNMLSYNRWTFATADAVLILASIGLDRLLSDPPAFRRWMLVPALATAAWGAWCVHRSIELPEPIQSQLETAIRRGTERNLSLEVVVAARHTFRLCYRLGAMLSFAAGLGWLTTFLRSRRGAWCRVAVIALLPCELLWFAALETREGDPALYFPRIPALEKLADLPRGRIWGIRCLPPDLNMIYGLEDVRGYDAVDPARYLRLFELARDPDVSSSPYAATQAALPKLLGVEGSPRLHPVSDLLNVRYLVLRLPPPKGFKVLIHQDGYWIAENPNALPRAFVPRTVRRVTGDDEALALMASDQFQPREIATMTADPKADLEVPPVMKGTARVRYPTPTRTELDVDMQTDGIVVISDSWDADWHARLDGNPCPLHCVDVALRGVRVPSGRHAILLTYEPQSVRSGLKMAAGAGLVLFLWAAWLLRTRLPATGSTKSLIAQCRQ